MEEMDIGEIRAQRREMAEKTMRSATAKEVADTVEQIFANRASHPWAQTCRDFLAEHAGEAAVRGELPDHHAFIYFPKSDKGLWYESSGPGSLEAVGMLHGNGLKTLAEIAAARNLAS